MKKVGVQKARDRLDRAMVAASKLDQNITLAEKQAAWSDFLVTSNTVFLMLEQAARGHGKSEAWYSRLNRVRKLDPMLQYLQQARHADEHTLYEGPSGLGRVDGIHHPAGFFIGTILEDGQEPVGVESVEAYDLATGERLADNGGFQPGVSNTSLWLNGVTNRGRQYDVPELHLGAPIAATPKNCAELAIAFLERTILDAGELDEH